MFRKLKNKVKFKIRNIYHNLISNLIMFLCRIEYKYVRRWNKRVTIFYIRGTAKDYPKYLMYTEHERVYNEFDKI